MVIWIIKQQKERERTWNNVVVGRECGEEEQEEEENEAMKSEMKEWEWEFGI